MDDDCTAVHNGRDHGSRRAHHLTIHQKQLFALQHSCHGIGKGLDLLDVENFRLAEVVSAATRVLGSRPQACSERALDDLMLFEIRGPREH